MNLISVEVEWKLTEPFKIEFDHNPTSISGPNGYGKTTLLNLIYFSIAKKQIPKEYLNIVHYFKLETTDGFAEYKEGEFKSNIESTEIYYINTFRDSYKIPTDKEYPSYFIDFLNLQDELFQFLIEGGTGKLICKVVPTGTRLDFDKFSNGFKNLALIGSALGEIKDGGVLLIDDFERSMHLVYQLEFKKRLVDLVRSGQLIYTAHSPEVFVSWDHDVDLFEITERKK